MVTFFRRGKGISSSHSLPNQRAKTGRQDGMTCVCWYKKDARGPFPFRNVTFTSQDYYRFNKRANMCGKKIAIKLAVIVATFTMEVATYASPNCSQPTLGFYSQSTTTTPPYPVNGAFDHNPATFSHTEFLGGYELRPWIQAEIVEEWRETKAVAFPTVGLAQLQWKDL